MSIVYVCTVLNILLPSLVPRTPNANYVLTSAMICLNGPIKEVDKLFTSYVLTYMYKLIIKHIYYFLPLIGIIVTEATCMCVLYYKCTV